MKKLRPHVIYMHAKLYQPWYGWRGHIHTSGFLYRANNWGVLCQKKVSRTGTSNYTPQYDTVHVGCNYLFLPLIPIVAQHSLIGVTDNIYYIWIFVLTRHIMAGYGINQGGKYTKILTKIDTPCITLTGGLWGVFCEYSKENWSCYNVSVTYRIAIAQASRRNLLNLS